MSARERAIDLWGIHPPQEFLYDHTSKQFLLDAQTIGVADLLPLFAHKTEPLRIPARLVDEVPLVLDVLGRPSHLPVMHEWLVSGNRESEFAETVTVMREVMSELDEFEYTEEEFAGGDHMSFGAGLSRPGHPLLHVHGNCACLGVDLYSSPFRERAWP